MERRRGEDSSYDEYHLTEKGRDLAPVVIALTHWGDRWAAPNGPPIIFRHEGCGGEIKQQILCEECHQRLHPGQNRGDPRPGILTAP